MIYYKLNEDGYIISHGHTEDFGDLIAEDSAIFLHTSNGELWRFINDEWINEKEGYKYFLIPSDIVPQISHYAGFVKEALFHLSFNVKVFDVNTIVEGKEVKSHLFINQIPCSCTHWTDEGLQLLDAVVENWNATYPLKPMREPYKFESYSELMEFINANKI